MFGLTTVKKSRVEKLQSMITTEKLNAVELCRIINELRTEIRGLQTKNNDLTEANKYQVKAIADLYAKHRKVRDKKGRFIKK